MYYEIIYVRKDGRETYFGEFGSYAEALRHQQWFEYVLGYACWIEPAL